MRSRRGPPLLFANAEVDGAICDVRVRDGVVETIGSLPSEVDEVRIDAAGGALFPGLHDHHIHLNALAARAASVDCGPPSVTGIDELADALSRPGTGWIRGIGYHESVAGLLDRAVLDRLAPDRPVRIQHRGGRMWFLNSAALEVLLARSAAPPGLDRATGRLFEEDRWLAVTLDSAPPDLAPVSRELAACGITGVTEMSPANGPEEAKLFAAAQTEGQLLQKLVLCGAQSLSGVADTPRLRIGPVKIHLHEAALPAGEDVVATIAAAHDSGRAVAIHCVTEVELVFALACLADAGTRAGDRIEHASVVPPELLGQIADMALQVVTQPSLVAERGDAYRAQIAEAEWPWLYRALSLIDAGITLAAGSDAPFAGFDPWAAICAAATRTTPSGATLGLAERITPEVGLALYLADPANLTRQRTIAVGEPADLCLLDRPWREVRDRPSKDRVRAVFSDGSLIHARADQAGLIASTLPSPSPET